MTDPTNRWSSVINELDAMDKKAINTYRQRLIEKVEKLKVDEDAEKAHPERYQNVNTTLDTILKLLAEEQP